LQQRRTNDEFVWLQAELQEEDDEVWYYLSITPLLGSWRLLLNLQTHIFENPAFCATFMRAEKRQLPRSDPYQQETSAKRHSRLRVAHGVSSQFFEELIADSSQLVARVPGYQNVWRTKSDENSDRPREPDLVKVPIMFGPATHWATLVRAFDVVSNFMRNCEVKDRSEIKKGHLDTYDLDYRDLREHWTPLALYCLRRGHADLLKQVVACVRSPIDTLDDFEVTDLKTLAPPSLPAIKGFAESLCGIADLSMRAHAMQRLGLISESFFATMKALGKFQTVNIMQALPGACLRQKPATLLQALIQSCQAQAIYTEHGLSAEQVVIDLVRKYSRLRPGQKKKRKSRILKVEMPPAT
jgi:hypothetical protein